MKRLAQFITNITCDPTKDYVLYWMQSAQRTQDNLALNQAIELANHYGKPLKVVFVINKDFKDANQRHFSFMFDGLHDVAEAFYDLGVSFEVLEGRPVNVLKPYLKEAVCLVSEAVYLDHVHAMKQAVYDMAKALKTCVLVVTTNLIVPPKDVSDKMEYAARTIRPKLLNMVDDYLIDLSMPQLNHFESGVQRTTIDQQAWLTGIQDENTTISKRFKGGQKKAYANFKTFCEKTLDDYDQSQDPSTDLTSKMSPYLHFGHISPLFMYKHVQWLLEAQAVKSACAEAFLEQLLIRRELAHNFTVFLKGYDQFETMAPDWALKTMENHRDDPREYHYDEQDYVHAQTHDEYFNAAMMEMITTGYMHNYMRMYWAKKIIEWSKTYEDAYIMILTLNNRYFIDGRDPVSYASVAWCFGRHDQAWKERAIFGKLRYMNANGLKRKFNIEAYVDAWLKK